MEHTARKIVPKNKFTIINNKILNNNITNCDKLTEITQFIMKTYRKLMKKLNILIT